MIFAINSATLQFSLALLDDKGQVVSEWLIKSREKNFTGFMPAVHSLFELSNSSPEDLDAIVVVNGPGSFTGLRVGLSAAKGMAQGLDIPIIGIPGLEVMASQISYTDNIICPMITSRKDEVFLALFKWEREGRMSRLMEDTCIRIGDIPSIINAHTIFLGTDFHKQGDVIQKAMGDNAILAPSYLWNIRASAVGVMGYILYVEKCFDDLRELVPAYMRPPDIRPNPFSRPMESDSSG